MKPVSAKLIFNAGGYGAHIHVKCVNSIPDKIKINETFAKTTERR